MSNKAKRVWPAALKAYVSRCFEAVGSNQEKLEVEFLMRELIINHIKNDTLWTNDWSKQPLVQQNVLVKPTMAQDSKIRSHSNPVIQQNSQPRKKQATCNISTKRRQLKRSSEHTLNLIAEEMFTKMFKPVRNSRFDKVDTGRLLVGRCQTLEKRYLRLTSEPDPETVRPIDVLQRATDYFGERWKKERNYSYICDQLKSIRQDLTVQRIRNEFAIKVYEMHARIALEKNDLGEYNQCQTQLISLYAENPGKGSPLEFLAYKILYSLHTKNLNMINSILIAITPQEANMLPVKHALAVRKAMADNNYHQLLGTLYKEAPNMGGFLMDCFVNRVRILALCTITKAFRPRVPLAWLATELGFETEVECRAWLESIENVQLEHDQRLFLLCKPSFDAFSTRLTEQKIDIKGQL